MYAGASALPNELVFEIAALACANSQADYYTFLLLSRGFYGATRLQCLRYVPIHLFSTKAIESFARLLQTRSDVAPYVNHLWTISTTKSEIAIARECTNLVSLACQSALLANICNTPTFKHTSLRELTIMTIWSPWEDIVPTPHGSQLCSQITHLRHFEGLPPDFPTNELTSLKHLSFASHVYRDFLMKQLSRIGDMPNMESIVITTSWPRGSGAAPEGLVKGLQEIDKRLRVVECERGFSEREIWCERTRLGDCLWTAARPDRIVAVGSAHPNMVPYN